MKIPKLEKWFAVQLSSLVICGNIYNKKNIPNGFTYYTGQIYGITPEYVVCKDRDPDSKTGVMIFKLGNVDKVWIQSIEARILDEYKL